MYHVYTLTDPRTNQVRYVGKSNNAEHRYMNHLSEKVGKSKVAWIQELKGLGLLPKLEVIDTAETDVEVQMREIYWINYYHSLGIPLTNHTGILQAATIINAKKRVKKEKPLPLPMEQEKLLTVEDIARMMGKSEETVKRLFRSGELQGTKIGGHWYMTQANWRKRLESQQDKK